MIDKFFKPISDLIGKAIPDKTKRMELEASIKSQMIDLQKSQNEINLAQAKHGSIFVAGARPAIMWVCAIGLFVNFFILPLMTWFTALFAPEINMPNFVDTGELISLTIALLGMGGLRSWEKTKGVARENMKK